MTVQIGRIPSEDRHRPRSLTSDPRGRFIALGRAYGEYLLDYAQELTADPAVAEQVAEKALLAATAHFEHADFAQVGADQARAERIRARRADLSQIGSWSEQAQVWTEQARADADPAGRSAPGRRAAESIRPWLYAAVRRECVARVQAAGGSVGAGRPGPAGRHAAARAKAGSDGAGRPAGGGLWAEEAVAEALTAEFEITELQAEELRVQASAVTQVLDGLPEQAREILGLAIRHGLGDDDIAVAMGMSRRRAGQERSEASARFNRLAVTVILLHAGWSGCERLDKMLGGSYPTAEPPSDKLCVKATKHSESCTICGRIVDSRGFGPELLSVLAIGRMPRPFRHQLSRTARELGRAPGSAPATRSREESRRQARADRAVPPAAGTAAAATGNGSPTSGSPADGSAGQGNEANGGPGQGGGPADGSAGQGGEADGRTDRGGAGAGRAGRGRVGGAGEVSAAAAGAAGSAAGVAGAAAAGATPDRQTQDRQTPDSQAQDSQARDSRVRDRQAWDSWAPKSAGSGSALSSDVFSRTRAPGSSTHASATPGIISPGSTSSGSTSPGSASPGRSSPASTSLGSTSPGSTNAESTSRGSTSPAGMSPDGASNISASSDGAGSGSTGPSKGPVSTGLPRGRRESAGAATASPGQDATPNPAPVTMAAPGSAAAASAGTKADAQRVSPESVSAQDAGARDTSASPAGSAPTAGTGAGGARDASSGGAPAWIFGSPGDAGGPDEPDSADAVTIGEEEGGGSEGWVTRPRAAAISALAIFVIVAGIMVAAKIADSPASHPASHPSPAAASTPTPAVSGTAPLVTQQSGKHTRKHAPGQKTATSLPPGTGILPTTHPVTTPPSGHSSSPTKPKPSPTPTKSNKPSSPPPSSPPTSSSPPPPSSSPPTTPGP